MKTYNVCLGFSDYEVDVEAESPEEAELIAIKMMKDEEYEPEMFIADVTEVKR